MTITLTEDQMATLNFALGVAAAATDHKETRNGILRLFNSVNHGRPGFVPYAILPDEGEKPVAKT